MMGMFHEAIPGCVTRNNYWGISYLSIWLPQNRYSHEFIQDYFHIFLNVEESHQPQIW